ncbi:unnamed protein product [Haemonchus placei]|uniref:C2H2-type domain-containing protein n=1 Tax=Haemonchus placei TaxID=6290 RepID=A0A0N4W6B9_HAEPC|nr:unnamed protein product [Haemonchus placei]
MPKWPQRLKRLLLTGFQRSNKGAEATKMFKLGRMRGVVNPERGWSWAPQFNVMVEIAVGDLYDQIASKQEGIVIHPEALYECKYCAMFQISGSELRDSDRGRSHAAAHRIAFEALLEPAPVLICPICDLPQKTSEVACVFGCMFNDLDLVEHLERDHSDILADDMVCDFSDPRYLFTTFREKGGPKNLSLDQRNSEQTNGPEGGDDRSTVVLSDGDEGSRSSSADDNRLECKHSPNGAGEGHANEADHNDSGDGRNSGGGRSRSGEESMEANASCVSEHSEPNSTQEPMHDNEHPPNNEGAVPMDTERDKRPENSPQEAQPVRKQMAGVSIITCLVCDWSPSSVHDSNRMRDELSSHVRLHIRDESNKIPSRGDSFFGDKRLLSCMDFSLEEYFEKEHLTDLSGTINSRIMERVYGDLLTKLFGICVPLVYRILHGNNGNPFRSPEMFTNKRRRARRVNRSKAGKDASKKTATRASKSSMRRTHSTSTFTTESFNSDADSSTYECADLLGIGNFETNQHIQCARAECGHYLLTPADRMSLVRHIAAHIRHDEMRLLKAGGVSPLVACDCGVAMGSPMGYIYHIVHDHVFERKKFTDLAATIVSYLMLIVETAIESVLAVRVDFRATRWTLWCAYFALENDEGDEKLFIDSTDLNEHWWKLWESLLDECVTGKNMTLGDTIKLFEMHPYVDEERLRTRKHKSIPVMDAEKIQRSLSAVWLHLNQWSNDPVNRVHLASESRWIRLAQLRRKVFLESKKKGDQNKADNLHSITICSIPSSFECKQRQLAAVADQSSPTALHVAAILFCQLNFHTTDSDAGSTTSITVNASASVIDVLDACSRQDAMTSANTAQEEADVAELSVKYVHCLICANICIRADNAAYIKNHCALHAVLEGRMLCSLYIHRAADRPQMCPFCPTEMNVYKPTDFLEHIRRKHEKKSRMIYDRFLHSYFPQSKIFSEPTTEESPREEEQCRSDFIIRCQRTNCCGVDPVIVLPSDKAIPLANVDIAVVKHMLWHVRNDSFLELDHNETEILTRALMIRLSCTQMRQVLFMARRVAKQFNKYKETDLIRYIQEKMEEIGCALFGVNKGLVFQMVFTRRFVRDQSGMQLYPPCVCRLCVDKELPRYSSDRRKRAFVAYAHPVVLHILEHLSLGQLQQDDDTAADLRWEGACSVDGLRFKNVSLAIKHVLDAHNDLVELSALDMMLEDMGIFRLFHNAISSALGEQAWQLEEALGFGAYKAKVRPRPDFFNEPAPESIHRPDCSRSWDSSTQLCACLDPTPSQQEPTSLGAEGSTPHPRRRMRATSLRDMPEASAACYAEFLNESEDREEHPSLPSFHASGDDEPSTSNLQTPTTALINTIVAQSAPASTVKVETDESGAARSGFENSITALAEAAVAVPSSADAGAEATENRMANSKKKRPDRFKRARQKRVKEIKREVDGMIVPQRNKALPLKNVIQGSKTVAAALVAAIGSPSSTGEGSNPQSTQQADHEEGARGDATESVRSLGTNASQTSSRTKKKSMNADGNNEEAELALGRVTKKPRLATVGTVGTEALNKVDSIATDYFRRRLRPPR